VDQHVVVRRLVAELPDLLPRESDLWLEQVRGPDRDRLLAAKDQPSKLGVGRHRRPAVEALKVVLQLLRHGRVAVAADHVVHGLRRDHLPDRRHQRRIAEVAPHAVGFLQHLGDLGACFVRSKLVVDVLQHLAGHLVPEDARIDTIGERAQVLDVPALEVFHVVLDIPHGVEVQARVVLPTLKGSHNALGRGL